MSPMSKLACAALALGISPILQADSEIDDGFQDRGEILLEEVGIVEARFHRFGWSTAIVPGYAVVSAPGYREFKTRGGGLFLFRLNAAESPPAVFVKILERFNSDEMRRQGETLSAQGDWIAASSSHAVSPSGEVSMYHRNEGGPNQWGLVKVVSPPNAPRYTPGDFGNDLQRSSVHLDGDLLVVGDVDGDSPEENSSGFAFIFERNEGGANNWGLVATLEDPTPDMDEDEEFGQAVAIYDGINADIAVIGAPDTRADDDTLDSGEAYVYVRQQGAAIWSLTKTLIGVGVDGRQARDRFGRSLEIDEETIIVGTGSGAPVGANQGSLHIFDRDLGGVDNWGEVVELNGAGLSDIDEYSGSMELSGDQLVVGGFRTREVYVYDRNKDGDDAWGLVQTLPSDPGSADTTASFGSGVATLGGFVVIGDEDRDESSSTFGEAGAVHFAIDDLIFCDDFEPEVAP